MNDYTFLYLMSSSRIGAEKLIERFMASCIEPKFLSVLDLNAVQVYHVSINIYSVPRLWDKKRLFFVFICHDCHLFFIPISILCKMVEMLALVR